MAQRQKIAIAGGGMVGLAQALALAGHGIPSIVIEPQPYKAQLARGFDGRTSALALGSARWLEDMGVWRHLKPHACPIRDIRITDNEIGKGASSLFVHYDHREATDPSERSRETQGEPEPHIHEPMGYIAENRSIRAALYQAAITQPLIEIREGVSAESMHVQKGHALLRLSDGSELETPLVVVAEGRASKLRAQAGIRIHEKSYGQTAIVATIAHEKPHHFVAQERFYPAGPFAILPMLPPAGVTLPLAHCSSIVWTEHGRFAARFAALPEAEFMGEVQRRFGDFLGRLALVKPVFTYPLSCMTAHCITAERLALVGDSAHRMHPIAGQGLNLGLRDAMELTDRLARQHAGGLDMGSADLLTGYDKARQFDIHSMIGFTHHLNGLFANDDAMLRTGRRLGMGLVEQLPPVKKLMMRRAMGL